MQSIRALWLIAIAALALPTYGHETIPENWCIDHKSAPQIISKFQWDRDELIHHIARCGIVDIDKGDLWNAANTAAHFYCEKQSPTGSLAVPFIVGPESYIDKSHHETYQLV